MQSLNQIKNASLTTLGPVGSTGLSIAVGLGLAAVVRYAIQGGAWAIRKMRTAPSKKPPGWKNGPSKESLRRAIRRKKALRAAARAKKAA